MTGKSLLDDTKAMLRSLIISSPYNVTMHALNRDYKDRMGKDIPYESLGYPNLKVFLHSLSDVLTIDAQSTYVTAVVAENSAHVHKLVSETKSKTKLRNNRGRGYSNPPTRSNSDHANHRQQPRTQSGIWDAPPSQYRPPVQVPYSSQNVYTNQGKRFEPGRLLAVPNSIDVNMMNMVYRQSLLGMPPVPKPLMSTDLSHMRFENYSNNSHPMSRNASNGQMRYSNSNRNRNEHRNEKFNRKTTNDNTSFDNDQMRSMTLDDRTDTKEDNNSGSNVEEIAALPPMDDNDPICHLGSKLKHHKYGKFIPPALIPKDLKAGGAYEIRVTEIISMCHFYFHLPDRYDDIVKIQELLSACYERESEYVIHSSDIQVGNVCASLYRDQWLRAEILTYPNENDHLKLLFVDFGTTDYVPINDIRYMQPELCEYRRQCHRGVLDFLKPVSNDKTERKIITEFCKMTSGKWLMGVVTNVDEDDVVMMVLVDTSSSEDMIINKMLMSQIPILD